MENNTFLYGVYFYGYKTILKCLMEHEIKPDNDALIMACEKRTWNYCKIFGGKWSWCSMKRNCFILEAWK